MILFLPNLISTLQKLDFPFFLTELFSHYPFRPGISLDYCQCPSIKTPPNRKRNVSGGSKRRRSRGTGLGRSLTREMALRLGCGLENKAFGIALRVRARLCV